MKIVGYKAILNNGTVIDKNTKVGEELDWLTPHWSHANSHLLKNQVVVKEETEGELLEAEMEIELQSFTETMAFAEMNPVRIFLEAKNQGLILAYYHFKDWWTRPGFVDSFDQVPPDSTLLFFKDEECYHFWIALPGKVFRAHFQGHAEKSGLVELVLSADGSGYTSLKETALAAVSDEHPYRCFEKGMAYAAKLYGVPMRQEREYPQILEKLGWCSWDAFYKEITHDGMLAKSKEIREKEIPFGWMLIDDGWQDYKEDRMCSFGCNQEKFPEGLKACVDQIEEITGINQVGVWHAFSGYWSGIHEDGVLAKEHPDWFLTSHQGKLLLKPEPSIVKEFFSEWYQKLQSERISFLKVDSQSSTRQHYRTNTPTGMTCKALHQGLDYATEKYMNGVLINCMGMAMENVLQRPISGISRNSDDFFPLLEESFKEHLLQNAYNGLWHNYMYYGDWDMFWSSHPCAKKHAVLRAISGGPIYVSDRVGDTVKEVLMPLCYQDGTILRASQGAVPTKDCILSDPEKQGYLKLSNTCGKVHYLAVYSYSKEPQECRLSLEDVEGLDKKQTYAIRSLESGACFVVDGASEWKLHLEEEAFELYQIAPIEHGFAAFGLHDKYLSSHAIIEETWGGEHWNLTLRESGLFAFYSKLQPKVICNGEIVECSCVNQANFYIAHLPEKEGEIDIYVKHPENS